MNRGFRSKPPSLASGSIFARSTPSRLFAVLALGSVLAHIASAQDAAASTPSLPLDPAMGIATIPLWNGTPPHLGPSAAPETPTLTIFRPQVGKANGTAVIVAPGGAYLGLASNLEGRQVADWLTARGITAFVLKYRLGPKNLYPVPLEDAQRAIRLVRSLTQQYGLSPRRIGMMGFSAGGHLAAATGTLFTAADPSNVGPSNVDPVARFCDRPDFLVLGYPWLNAMQPNNQKLITYCSLIKTVTPEQCKSFETEYTPTLHVTAKTPPTFIYHTSDDKTVPVSASIDFYSALTAAGVSAELHVFRHGSHGSGLGAGEASLDQWPALLEQWLRDQGLLEVDPAAAKAAMGSPAR